PSRASVRASALPIPLAPPVTMATLPATRPMSCPPVVAKATTLHQCARAGCHGMFMKLSWQCHRRPPCWAHEKHLAPAATAPPLGYPALPVAERPDRRQPPAVPPRPHPVAQRLRHRLCRAGPGLPVAGTGTRHGICHHARLRLCAGTATVLGPEKRH